jgi:uncharacterized protein (TIGR04222 family)
MMDAKQVALYEKLQAFAFEAGPTALSFADRLAKENGWRVVYAERVIAEYKRFLFLAMCAGHPASPSDPVDQAWHLHLVYTRSYWDDLCRGVLGRPLHHGPTLGGAAEQEKHNDWYENTLASYRTFFSAEPPADIWPPLAKWQQTSTRYERVNRAQYWLLPKVRLLRMPRLPRLPLKMSAGVLGVFALPLAMTLNPLDMRGPLFLVLFIALFAVALVMGLMLRRWHAAEESPHTDKDLDLDVEQLAFLNSGQKQMTQAIIAGMLHDGSLEIRSEKKAWYSAAETRLYAAKALPPDAGKLALLIHKEASRPDGLSITELPTIVSPYAERVKQSLEDRGLFDLRWNILAAVPMGIVFLLGATKFMVGLSRDKAVAFLAIGCVIAFIATVVLAKSSRLSGKGQGLLSAWKKKHAKLETSTVAAGLAPADMMLAVAMFGIAAGSTPQLNELRNALGPGNTSASCGSSCGSSGGSCGGGGCGGGGCGGCGGGGD